MGGRGRGGGGRGRGASFNIEALGLARGEMPQGINQPPPLFPALAFAAVPLATGEDQDYLLAVKQEFQNTLRDSPFFVRPPLVKKDIDRYSDRYQLNSSTSTDGDSWQIDWSRFPSELKGVRRKKVAGTGAKPNVVKQKTLGDDINIESKLKELESKEAKEGEPDEQEKKPKEGEEDEDKEIEDDEFYDEEELEEGTDYNTNYFDNGEEFDDEEDNLDDGAVY